MREQLDATPEEVYAVITNSAFQDEKCAATSEAGAYEVAVTEGAGGRTVHTSRQLPSTGLPDVARSFVGDTLTVVEDYAWGAPAADGSRQASVDMHVKGAPLTMKGTLRLVPDGAGSAQVLDAELKANVPFLGGTIEKSASGPINAAIELEARMIRERLAR